MTKIPTCMMQEKAEELYQKLKGIEFNKAFSGLEKLPKYRSLIESALAHVEREEKWPKADTLSSRLAFAAYRQNWDRGLQKAVAKVRMLANSVLHESYSPTIEDEKVCSFATGLGIAQLLKVNPPTWLGQDVAEEELSNSQIEGKESIEAIAKKRLFRGVVLKVNLAEQTMILAPDKDAYRDFDLQSEYVVHVPASLLDTLSLCGPGNIVHLAHSRIDGLHFYPRWIVWQPDYLVDVSTLSNCVDRNGGTPADALKHLLVSDESSQSQLMGTVVNSLLDELVSDPLGFSLDTFKKEKLLSSYPLEIATLYGDDDKGLRDWLSKLVGHFETLQTCARSGFTGMLPPGAGGYLTPPLALEDCSLEPSFLSSHFGLQGRLDLLHQSGEKYTIIELKSSAPARNFIYDGHAAQARLYRLMMQSMTLDKEEPLGAGKTFVLYSRPSDDEVMNPLRQVHMPTSEDGLAIDPFIALLNLRNVMVSNEYKLATANNLEEVYKHTIGYLTLALDNGRLSKFNITPIKIGLDMFHALDETTRRYLLYQWRFITREKWSAKVGNPSQDEALRPDRGQAAMWTLSEKAKLEAFTLMPNLRLDRDPLKTLNEENPHLQFKVEEGSGIANFRPGDMVVLYPTGEKVHSSPINLKPGEAQLIKCTLQWVDKSTLRLGTRHRKISQEYLAKYATWAIEHDHMDSTFRNGFGALIGWTSTPKQLRDVQIGLDMPRVSSNHNGTIRNASKSIHQAIEEAFDAPHYYLLCGPPGTGKTSGFIKGLVHKIVSETTQSILLAAYTNRAVDELCAKLEELGVDYLRVGSRSSTPLYFHHRLLDFNLGKLATRSAIKERLQACKIIVGTTASLTPKSNLFRLKKFDIAILDEASQLLDTNALGIISRAPKFVMVGDHNQLPAVVTQPHNGCIVDDEHLHKAGIFNLTQSYFERLYLNAQNRGWTHAYGILNTHYRMHSTLAGFVNQYYYDNALVAGNPSIQDEDYYGLLRGGLGKSRLTFVDVPAQTGFESHGITSRKVHVEEASFAASIAISLLQSAFQNQVPSLEEVSTFIGIIAPWRNQVAQIKACLREASTHLSEQWQTLVECISVDTVERYQGSERDFIIYSCCLHSAAQLDMISSTDAQNKVDRKLNVALTRAKKGLFVLGNSQVLVEGDHYRNLVEWIDAKGTTLTVVEAKRLLSMEKAGVLQH